MRIYDAKISKKVRNALIELIDSNTYSWKSDYLNSDKSISDLELYGDDVFISVLRVISKASTKLDLDRIKGIYNAVVNDKSDLNSVGIFKKFLNIYSEQPHLFTDNFSSLISVFDSKDVAFNYFKLLYDGNYAVFTSEDDPNIVTFKKNYNDLEAIPIRIRKYYLNESCFFSALALLCLDISHYQIQNMNNDEFKEILNKHVNEARKQAGIYEIDESLLSEIDERLNGLDGIRENLNTLFESSKSLLDVLKEQSKSIKSEILTEKKRAIEGIKNETSKLLTEFEKKYLEILNDQKKDLTNELDLSVESLNNEYTLRVQKLQMLADTISARVTSELNRVREVSDSSISSITNLIDNEGIKNILEANKELIDNYARVDSAIAQISNAKTRQVIVSNNPENEILIAPTVFKPVRYAIDNNEFAPVNHFLDDRISFASRMGELMERMEKLQEEKGYHFHSATNDLLTLILENMNPYMIGPSGSGKTYLVSQISELLDLDYCDIGYINEEYDLIGFKTANGTFSKTNFYDAYKFGIIAFCDELDNGNPAATVKLNSFATNIKNASYCFPNGETVKRHPNFRIIAAGNTNGFGATDEYGSRQKIDESVRQRLTPIYIGFDEEIEKKVLEKYPDWFEFVKLFRKATEEYSKEQNIEIAQGIVTTRDVDKIKEILDNRSFGENTLDKIVKYLFIQNKDDDYLGRIKYYLENSGRNLSQTSCNNQIKSFVKQIKR